LGASSTHPLAIALFGLALLVMVPIGWGFLRRTQGLPMFGSPTVEDIEQPAKPDRDQVAPQSVD
jgi:hypothetical protein